MQNHHSKNFLENECEHILNIFQNTKKKLENSSQKYCFDKHNLSHSEFIQCLEEKYKFLEIYQQNFLSKYDFEKLNLYKCLKPKGSADIVPDICFSDFENHVFKNMKDFSNILK